MRVLIDDYPLLFEEMRQQEAEKARALQGKVARLAAVVEGTRRPAPAEVEGPGADPECLRLFRQLFHFLARVERRIHRASHVTASSPPSALQSGLGGVSPPRRHRSDREGRRRHRGGAGEHGRPTRANSASPRLRSPAAAAEKGGGRKVSRGEEDEGEEGREGTEGEGEEGTEGEEDDDEEEAGGEPFSFVSPRWEVGCVCVCAHSLREPTPIPFPTTQPPKQNKNAQTCGFIRGDPGCEMGPSGQATLRGIAHFCRRFPCIAAEMAFQYSHHGKRGQTVSFPALCGLVRGLGEGCVRGCQSLWTRRDGSPKKTQTHKPSYEQQCPHTHHDRPTLLLHPPPNTQR